MGITCVWVGLMTDSWVGIAGALPFIRDPYDMDNEEPFGQLMTAPMRDQMVRAAAAFAVMACLAVVCIHVPIRAATVLAPALFPLRLKLVDALAELPADLLLFHVCLPLTLPHLHLRRARSLPPKSRVYTALESNVILHCHRVY